MSFKRFLLVILVFVIYIYSEDIKTSDEEFPLTSKLMKDSPKVGSKHFKFNGSKYIQNSILSHFVKVFPDLNDNYLSRYKRDSVLFTIDSKAYETEANFDSTYSYVVFNEKQFDDYTGASVVYPLDEYVKKRSDYQSKEMFKKEVSLARKEKEEDSFFSNDGEEMTLNIPVRIKNKTFNRVFGGDRIGLRIRGNIQFSVSMIGRTYKGQSYSASSSSNFTPKMDNKLDFTVRGKVGTKVDVDISQDTEKMDIENSLRVTYTGDSDEIIESVHAGNIGLSLPNTRYITFSGTNKGLFGLKTKMRLGNIHSTFIASVEEGQKQEKNLDNGRTKGECIIYAEDFIDDKYFYVDSIMLKQYNDNYNNIINGEVFQVEHIIEDLQLYVTSSSYGSKRRANLYQVYQVGQAIPDPVEVNMKVKLLEEGVDYTFDKEKGLISVSSKLSTGAYLAARYKRNDGNNTIVEYGEDKDTDDGLFLQIIAQGGSSYSDPWYKLIKKNVYALKGAYDIDKQTVKMEIRKKDKNGSYNILTWGSDETNLLKYFKVSTKDDETKFDIRYLDLNKGEFEFPALLPFTKVGEIDPQLEHSIIYKDFPVNENSDYQFYFEYDSRSASMDLGMNVLKGSERVTAGGVVLVKDVDYSIDYYSGQLTIINSKYEDANINVKYESGSLFKLDRKILLGNRTEYRFSENGYIGATIIYLDRTSTDDKVHVGYEPFSNISWGLNGKYDLNIPFLTSMIDKLPLIHTEQVSNMSMEAEFAEVIPEPNTLNKAYVDDFEASNRVNSLGINYSMWTQASMPDEYLAEIPSGNKYIIDSSVEGAGLLREEQIPYFLKNYRDGEAPSLNRFYWYNPKDDDQIKKEDIYGTDLLGNKQADQKVKTLEFRIKPKSSSPGNIIGDIDPKDSWGGVMKPILGYQSDFSEKRYIELVLMATDSMDLHIDIGNLSEDVIPNRVLDTEDTNDNGILDKGENKGLDGMSGKGDKDYYALIPDSTKKFPFDYYSYDDYPDQSISEMNYANYNKTEGNNNSYIDQEDLNRDGNNNTRIEALRYSLKLNDHKSKYLVTSYKNGYKQYRIPLSSFKQVINRMPDLSKIKFVKIWFNNINKKDKEAAVSFVSMDVVGNEWQVKGEDKQYLKVSTIDSENQDYNPPFALEKNNDGNIIKEQSLLLKLDYGYGSNSGLDHRKATAKKKLLRFENLLGYKKIGMYVHGDKKHWPNQTRDVYFVFRFGNDSLNYYEYRSKLTKGWSQGNINNKMDIMLDSLTVLKQYRNKASFNSDELYLKPYNNKNIARFIGVRGEPSLRNIRYQEVGVIDYSSRPLQADIWVDDIILTDVRKNKGRAMRFKTSLKGADLFNVTAEYEDKDADFHTVNTNKGSDKDSKELNISTGMNMGKFFAKEYDIELPVNYNYTKKEQIYKYMPESDILVDQDNVPDIAKIEETNHTTGFSFDKRSESKNSWIAYTLDRVSFSGKYNFRKKSDDKYYQMDNNSYNYSLGYSLRIPTNWVQFKPFSWIDKNNLFGFLSDTKLEIMPSKYDFRLNTNQSINDSHLRGKKNVAHSETFTTSGSFSASFTPLPFWTKSSFSLSFSKDMNKIIQKNDSIKDVFSNYGDLFKRKFGTLTSLSSSWSNNFNLGRGKYYSLMMGYGASYGWKANLESASNRVLSNKYSNEWDLSLNINEFFGDIDKYLRKDDKLKNTSKKNLDSDSKASKSRFERKNTRSGRRVVSSSKDQGVGFWKFMWQNLRTIKVSYSQNRNNTNGAVNSFSQGNWDYWLGFDNSVDNDKEQKSYRWNGGWALSFSTGLGISKKVNISGISYKISNNYKYENNLNQSTVDGKWSKTAFLSFLEEMEEPIANGGNKLKADRISYLPIPNYTISVSGLEDFFPPNDILKSIRMEHSKSGSVLESWKVPHSVGIYIFDTTNPYYFRDIIIPQDNVESRNYSLEFAPFIGFKFDFTNSIKLSIAYDYSYNVEEKYNIDDDYQTVMGGSKSKDKSLRVSVGYHQKGGFQLPFNFWPFDDGQISSDIDYQLGVGYTFTEKYDYAYGKGFIDSKESGSINISPSINFKISKRVNGTVSYNYNSDSKKEANSESRETSTHKLSFTATMRITG